MKFFDTVMTALEENNNLVISTGFVVVWSIVGYSLYQSCI